MMLGVSGLMGSSGDGAAAEETHESGGASSEAGGASSSIPGGGLEESGGGSGNRWPRQETLALLKIRSDMDVAFRDSSLKGPLWDEVSRKMAELGFQRSAKKCKEKFENVYKYHKRTKDGRTSKPDGKSYRFFDQLAALENTPPPSFTPPPRPATTTTAAPPSATPSPTPLSIFPPNPNYQITSSIFQQSQPVNNTSNPPQNHNFQQPWNSTSSSTSSDEDIQRRRGRKRNWKDYFERLMKEVVHKQEELQKKFLDTLEKRENERAMREEALRVQEMARRNREHERLVQERSNAAAKDTAVIAFLQKVTDQQTIQIPMINHNNSISIAPPQAAAMQVHPPPENPQTPRQPPPTPTPPPQQQQTALPPPPAQPAQPPPPPVLTLTPAKRVETSKTDNGGGENFFPASSSRWPKAEVEALINLRVNLDLKYQDNSPKGPLWEEISSAMAKLGYNRSAKRCKEKWENINKYYKKVKESNKKRPEDSKTCPYFHQLEAIYKDKASFNTAPYVTKPENSMVPIMARPEQQWPMPDHHQQQQQNQDSVMHDPEHDNESENNDEGSDDGDDEDEGGNYEIIANKQPSTGTNAV